MSRDPERVAAGLIITGILFLAIFFNWGGKWRSKTKRRIALVACSSGMLAGAAFFARDLALLPLQPFDALLTLAGISSLLLALALCAVALLWPNEPEQS